MSLKGIVHTLILTSVILVINCEENQTNACCTIYEDTKIKVAWLICGQNNTFYKNWTEYETHIIIRKNESINCIEAVQNHLQQGNFELNQLLDNIQNNKTIFENGTTLKLASRAFSGFNGITHFTDSKYLNEIESDAFDDSSVKIVSFHNYSKALRFDDNAFRQKKPTVDHVNLIDVGRNTLSPNVFKSFKNIPTIEIYDRSIYFTCPYLQYATDIKKLKFKSGEQPFSSCFLCGAPASMRFCITKFTFEGSGNLFKLKESFSDVTNQEPDCLVIKSGMAFNQSKACKNDKCIAECSQTESATSNGPSIPCTVSFMSNVQSIPFIASATANLLSLIVIFVLSFIYIRKKKGPRNTAELKHELNKMTRLPTGARDIVRYAEYLSPDFKRSNLNARRHGFDTNDSVNGNSIELNSIAMTADNLDLEYEQAAE